MRLSSFILAGVVALSPILADAALASGSAIQQLRSTEGKRTVGGYGSTGGTGILTKKQRRKFGYRGSRNSPTQRSY